MSDVVREERRNLDVQFSYLRRVILAPYEPPGRPYKIEDLTAFTDTAEEIGRSKQQSPEEMLTIVTQVWHPYFEARAEIEKTLPPEEMN